MKHPIFLAIIVSMSLSARAQFNIAESNEQSQNLGQEVARLKEMIRQLQENELQSDKSRYQKNYQLIVNGIEIIKEMYQGTLEISGARSQNIFYKKLLDINNPNSEALGFQLLEVINKTTEENINLLPLTERDKRRLRGQVTNVFDGLKRVFPPLQIISSVFSVFSGFNTYQARVERLSRKADSLIVDVNNPISGAIVQKINQQLQPYISFYAELDRTNNIFENALYQHEVQYRDYLEEINNLKQAIEKRISWNETIGDQISDIFDLGNSSRQDFNYKEKLETEPIRDLVSNCITVYEMVDRYKKFTNDFIIIQDDFYKKNLSLLEKNARNLPYKDNVKIDQLIEELHQLKNGNPSENRLGFDASYKMRLKSILAKLHTINKLRT
jgi:hypothetical protein